MQIEPFGMEWHQMANIIVAIFAAQGVETKVKDFLPYANPLDKDPPPTEADSYEQLLASLKLLNAAWGPMPSR